MKSIVLLFVLLINFNPFGFNAINFNLFAREKRIGRFIIMGWKFENGDSALQTNNAIDALLLYVEAAKRQMSSYEAENLSCQIVLYKQPVQRKHFIQEFYIFINSRSDTDFHDRCMEFKIFTYDSENTPVKYTLAIFYNNYDWFLYDTAGREFAEMFLNGEEAYTLFVSEINKMRK